MSHFNPNDPRAQLMQQMNGPQSPMSQNDPNGPFGDPDPMDPQWPMNNQMPMPNQGFPGGQGPQQTSHIDPQTMAAAQAALSKPNADVPPEAIQDVIDAGLDPRQIHPTNMQKLYDLQRQRGMSMMGSQGSGRKRKSRKLPWFVRMVGW